MSQTIIDPKNKLWPIFVGNMLEFYDLGLYGFYALIIYKNFFPDAHHFAKTLATGGIFAAGFIMRPMGAVIFGYIGDIYGRKKVLLLTLWMTAACSFLIGISPTYEDIGISASLILTTLRLVQGLCTGGEYNTAAIFVLEQTPRKRHGLLSGFITATAIFGFFLSAIVAYLTSLPSMPVWAWRLSFIFGGLIALVGYQVRRATADSKIFLAPKSSKKAIPLMNLFQFQRKTVCLVIGIGWLAGVLSLLIVGFLHSFFVQNLNINPVHAWFISVSALILYLLTLPLFGYLSDYTGHRQMMQKAAFCTLLFSLPLFLLFNTGDLRKIMIASLLLSLLASAFLSPMHAFMFDVFPASQRCSGISFCFSMGVALFGSTAPMIANFLIYTTGLNSSPSCYLALSAVIGFLCLTYLPQRKGLQINEGLYAITPADSRPSNFSSLGKED